jgi:hypothetical protein
MYLVDAVAVVVPANPSSSRLCQYNTQSWKFLGLKLLPSCAKLSETPAITQRNPTINAMNTKVEFREETECTYGGVFFRATTYFINQKTSYMKEHMWKLK